MNRCRRLILSSWRYSITELTVGRVVGLRLASKASVSQQHGHSSDLFAKPRITLSRVAMPVDTQHLGFVHGGVLLSLMEEAGDLHCTRYCRQHLSYGKDGRLVEPVAILGHVEKTLFMHPVKMGDLMQIETEVVYTSLRSLRAFVSVYALNFKGRRMACQSVFWYVPINKLDHSQILQVPALNKTDQQLFDEGQKVYKQLLTIRQQTDRLPSVITSSELLGTSDYVIQPFHCGEQSVCKGGPMMKWIDECAGRDAVIHSLVPVVTASIESMRFYVPVPVGSFVSIVSKPVFASKRTIDMYSVAYRQRFNEGNSETVVYERVADAILTFAAFKKDKTATTDSDVLIDITPETDDEKRIYEERKKKYEERKAQNS